MIIIHIVKVHLEFVSTNAHISNPILLFSLTDLNVNIVILGLIILPSSISSIDDPDFSRQKKKKTIRKHKSIKTRTP